MKKYTVKSPFYLGGVVQATGSVVELDDEQFEVLSTKNVLGKEVEEEKTLLPSNEPLTIEDFGSLTAAEQKSELQRLEIEGEAGNKEERIALYSAYLAGEVNAQNQTGGSSDIGTGGSESDQGTTEN